MSFRWGLIPWWSKDAKSGSRLFNARGETVATRASFREAFRERRIIVPADGFYEWHKTKTGTRQPYYFSRADGQPLAFAGLAERWRDKNAGPDVPLIRSCTVITTSAGPDMSGIHDRMPVILDPATFDVWLDPANEDVEEMRALLRPPPAGTVVHHRVGYPCRQCPQQRSRARRGRVTGTSSATGRRAPEGRRATSGGTV